MDESARLEIVWAERPRGFESLSLRVSVETCKKTMEAAEAFFVLIFNPMEGVRYI